MYLKVMHGLHLFFLSFFLGARLLMSFHGHSCPSIMIICTQLQTEGASGRGCGNGASAYCLLHHCKMLYVYIFIYVYVHVNINIERKCFVF